MINSILARDITPFSRNRILVCHIQLCFCKHWYKVCFVCLLKLSPPKWSSWNATVCYCATEVRSCLEFDQNHWSLWCYLDKNKLYLVLHTNQATVNAIHPVIFPNQLLFKWILASSLQSVLSVCLGIFFSEGASRNV